MNRKIGKIPKFKSIAEEAAFWDTHDFVEFADELKQAQVKAKLKEPKEEVMTVRLQPGVKKQLASIAEEMGVNTSTLARMWIVEKMKQLSNST